MSHKRPIYFASYSASGTSYLKRSDEDFFADMNNMTKSPRVMNSSDENAYFHHPYILFSAYHHYSRAPNLRDDLQLDDDTTIMIDSGGFQLSSGTASEKTWNKEKALDYSERWGDIFPILDWPVTNLKKASDVDFYLNKTMESSKYYYENRSNSNCTILNVLSAHTVDEMEYWYNTAKKYEFDGWAHGGAAKNIKSNIKAVLFLLNKGEYDKEHIHYHHIFGVSRVDTMLYFAVMQKLLDDMGVNVQLVYDSSYFQQSLAYGNYFAYATFKGIQSIRMSNQFDWSKLNDEFGLPCNCPVCEDIDSISEWLNNPQEYYVMGSLHNLWVMLRAKEMVERVYYMNVPEVFETIPAYLRNNVRAIEKAFSDPKNGYFILDKYFEGADEVDKSCSLQEFFE